MGWSTAEQLKAWWTPAKKAARAREDAILNERYPGQYVAYTDEWNGEELTRTVVALGNVFAEIQAQVAKLPSEVRKRLRYTEIPLPDGPFTIGSAFFE